MRLATHGADWLRVQLLARDGSISHMSSMLWTTIHAVNWYASSMYVYTGLYRRAKHGKTELEEHNAQRHAKALQGACASFASAT